VFSFKGSPFRTYEAPPYANSTIFKNGDIDILNGDLDATGGKVTAKNPNGTYPTTTITFGAPIVVRGDEYVTSVDATTGGTAFTDRSNFVVGIRISHCINLEWFLTSPHEAIWESGYNPTPTPPTPPTPHPAPPWQVHHLLRCHWQEERPQFHHLRRQQRRPVAQLARLLPLGNLRWRHPLRRPEGRQRGDGY
jgi:hypothetical protein